MIKIRVVKAPDIRAIQQNMLRAIEAEMLAQAQWGIDYLQDRIRDWSLVTKMDITTEVKPGKWRFEIRHNSQTLAGKVFDWTDLGTVPHIITPKGPYPLRFSVPHSPKTLAPTQSMPTGSPTDVLANLVHHPGTMAREFTPTLKANYMKNNRLVNSIHLAARKGLAIR